MCSSDLIAQQASDDGMCVVWNTTLPRGNTAGWDATKQGEMDELVGLIRATSITNVSIVDSYTAMEGDPGDLDLAYDFGDGVHLLNAGNVCMAQIVSTGFGSAP